MFEGTQGEEWDFAVLGLPQGTGVRVDSAVGVISGVATQADAFLAQPLQIIVTATNARFVSCLFSVFASVPVLVTLPHTHTYTTKHTHLLTY
jgi:hypothetical protein